MSRKPKPDPRHIKDLVPDAKNRRKHTPRNVGFIVDALQKVGAARSVVIDENNELLAGNATIEAAAEAGITKVRVVDADGSTIIAVRRRGLTDQQKRALAIFDNRSAELAEWDVEQLRADLDAGEDLLTFFRQEEIDALLAQKPGVDGPDLGSGDIAEKPDMVRFSVFVPADQAKEIRGRVKVMVTAVGGCLVD